MSLDSKTTASRRPRRAIVVWVCITLLSLTAVAFSQWLTQIPPDDSERTDFRYRFGGGSLVIAGGGPLPAEVRSCFLDLAGGARKARLVVIPAYDATPQQLDSLQEIWRKFDVSSIEVLHATDRADANRDDFTAPLDDATGVWLSGGTQAWLSRHYAGTRVEEKLQAVVRRGGVVGGSSAGAAAMTKVMIEQGLEDAIEGVGFDLFQGAVIDQHFLRRSRMNRLLRLMEAHPDRVAFGIDEGTALVVQVPKGRLGVIGASYVLAYIPKTDEGESRFEVLKHRDHVTLAELKSGQGRVSSPSELDAALSEE